MLVACELTVRAFVDVRNVGPSFTTYSPVYGKRLRRSISVKRITPEFEMRLSTNAQGFRQPDEVPAGSNPILFLGDSFTMGYGVSDGEEFVSVIRRQLPPQSGPFLNAGMGDNGNGRWIKFLNRDAPRYAPKLVVLQVMDNDFYDNPAEGLYVLRDGELVEQPIAPPGPREWIQSALNAIPLIARLHLVGLMRQVRNPTAVGPNDDAKPAEKNQSELTYRLVDRAIEICQEHGWPVLGLSVGLQGSRIERMRRIFADRGVTLLEAPNRESRPDLYYRVDGHWNAKGHAYVAQLLLGEMRQVDAAAKH